MVIVKGQHIDRFVVVRLLGEGGIGQVYLVQHQRLLSLHALKVLQAADKATQRRFLQEGRAQARIRHPNVVAATDVVELPDGVGLVMEYVEGPNLAEVLDGGEPMARADVLPLFRQLLAGVSAAHAAGVLHRDLKPANVLLAAGDGGVHAKIADFGLAKLVEGTGTVLTRAGVTMGTPGYMAPEQLADAASVDARADIFSLGCILYELCTGRGPFAREDIASTWGATLAGEHRRLDEVDPGLPPALVAAVERAIAVQAAHRFATVAAFEAALGGLGPEDLARRGEDRGSTLIPDLPWGAGAPPGPGRSTLAPGTERSGKGSAAAGDSAPLASGMGSLATVGSGSTLGPSGSTLGPSSAAPRIDPRAARAASRRPTEPTWTDDRPDRFATPRILAEEPTSRARSGGDDEIFHSRKRGKHRPALIAAGVALAAVLLGGAAFAAREAGTAADAAAVAAKAGASELEAGWSGLGQALLDLGGGSTDPEALWRSAETVRQASSPGARASACRAHTWTLHTEADRQATATDDAARKTSLKETQRQVDAVADACARWAGLVSAAEAAGAGTAAELAVELGFRREPPVGSVSLGALAELPPRPAAPPKRRK